jgi:hypothetical protein
VTIKQVLVFMLILSNNMNIRVNQRMLTKYLKAGHVPEAPVAPFSVLDIVSVQAVRCSRTKSMQCRWPSGSSRGWSWCSLGEHSYDHQKVVVRAWGSSRSRYRVVVLVEKVVAQEVVIRLEGEVVDWGGSEQLREDTPQNLIARYPAQDRVQGFRGLLSPELCTQR